MPTGRQRYDPDVSSTGSQIPKHTSRVPTPLVVELLPRLAAPKRDEFNVFSVMHHGTHEKQLSNVFAWLLRADGSHGLDQRFLEIFLEEINLQLHQEPPIDLGDFGVTQEVNTSPPDEPMDIADIVLEGVDTVVVVENYYVSDGHGHGYAKYKTFAAQSGKRPVVVLLCRSMDETLLSDGWEGAAVVTYPQLLDRLVAAIQALEGYVSANPEPHWFIQQMYRFFVRGAPVDSELIDFVTAMCASGQAGRFRGNPEVEAANLAQDLQELAVKEFTQSRELLQRIKGILRSSVAPTLVAQVNGSGEEPLLGSVSARYQGIYQWSVNIHSIAFPDSYGNGDGGPGVLQIKFGPSAWYANSQDPEWRNTIDDADYSRLFLTWNGRIHQSQVRLREVADGLADSDLRLRDEVFAIVSASH